MHVFANVFVENDWFDFVINNPENSVLVIFIVCRKRQTFESHLQLSKGLEKQAPVLCLRDVNTSRLNE